MEQPMRQYPASKFATALFQTTESLWTTAREGKWESAIVQTQFNHLTGTELEAARRVAFDVAFDRARNETLAQFGDKERTAHILQLFDGDPYPDFPDYLAEESVRMLWFSGFPDVPRLTSLCHNFWLLEPSSSASPEVALTAEHVAVVLTELLLHLREALHNDPVCRGLLQPDMRHMLKSMLTPACTDEGESTYRVQMFERCRRSFVIGLSGIVERADVSLSDVFVPLWAERQTHIVAMTEMMLAMQTGNEAIHPRKLRRQRGHGGERVALREILQSSSCIVLLGDSGSGKHMWLSNLATLFAEGTGESLLGRSHPSGEPFLPIFVSLREYAAGAARCSLDYSLLHHIYAYASEHLLCTPKYGFFEQILEEGRCIVCLDGLDQVWDRQQRQAVSKAIMALAERFPQSYFIVTSRLAGYQSAALDYATFDHYLVQPLSDSDMHMLINTMYQLRERERNKQQRSKHLIASLARESSLRLLARNPLLLTMMVVLHHAGRELPQSRVDVYEAYIASIVETWQVDSDASSEYAFGHMVRRLLGQLASELHYRSQQSGSIQTISEEEVEGLLVTFLCDHFNVALETLPVGLHDDVRHLVQKMRRSPGLFLVDISGEMMFSHMAFQEYLVASDLLHRCEHATDSLACIWQNIEEYLHCAHWREVVCFVLERLYHSYHQGAIDLVQRMMQSGEQDRFEHVLHRHLYLVARILSRFDEVPPDINQQVVDALLHIARHATWGEQQDAFRALTWLDNNDYAIEGVLTLAWDMGVDAMVRLDASVALSKLGRKDEASQAFLALAYDPQADLWNSRTAAMELAALGRRDEASEALLTLTRNRQGGIRERCMAAVALGTLGRTDEAVEVLLTLAREPQGDAGVRRNAAETLGMLGRKEIAAEVLLELAGDAQQNAWQRRYAAEALGVLGRVDDASAVLLALARDNALESRVRRFAVEALGNLGHVEKEALEDLHMMVAEEQRNPWERASAAMALGKLGRGDEAVRVLLDLAQEPQWGPSLRRTAAVGLGTLGHTDESADVLMTLASDSMSDPWDRCIAAMALGMLGRTDKAVLDGLLVLAHNPKMQADERSTAAVALATLGRTDEAVEVLLALASDKHVAGWVRRTAYDSLSRLVACAG